MNEPQHSDDRPVTREYLDLRLDAEIAKLRSEIADFRAEMFDRFAAADRRLLSLFVPLFIVVLGTLLAVLVR
jgi:hypothetical protein